MVFKNKKHKKVESENKDILSQIDNYALIKSKKIQNAFTIYDVKNQSFVLVEEHQEVLITLMKEKGVRVVEEIEDVIDPNFIRYMLKWDEQKKEFVKIKAPNAK